MVEWVEVRGKTIDVAVAAAMNELGIDSRDQVDVEVMQEPEKGFLGLGGRDAIVRVKPKPRRQGRKRPTGTGRPAGQRNTGAREQRPGSRSPGRSETNRGGQRGSRGSGQRSRPPGGERQGARELSPRRERIAADVDPNQQAPAVNDFLSGLLASFGLEATVSVSVADDVVLASIDGEQAEALVGPRGQVMEAIHEITKTVLHRQFVDTARVRIDIAGYAERRRQALSIYAKQLISQVQAEGGEIMLEPMSAADRKVIHDAVAETEGVISYSEGEPPRRYVVIATGDAQASPPADEGEAE